MVILSPWLQNLLVGQLLAVLLMGTGACASQLSSMSPNSNFPAMLAFLNYFLCSTYLIRPILFGRCGESSSEVQVGDQIGGISKRDEEDQKPESYQGGTVANIADNGRKESSMEVGCRSDGCNCSDLSSVAMPKQGERLPSIWWYVLAGFIDLQANFLIISAYSFTSITSVAIIDCFSIPSVMLISFFLLRSRYQWKHYFGVSLCIAGVLGIIANDTWIKSEGSDKGREGQTSLTGDLLAVGGAFLYACSNVLQEKMVKYGEREQYVGRIGLFGMGFATALFFSMEWVDFERALPLSLEAGMYIVGFVMCLFFFYTNTSQFLTQNDAVLFNLSLCASDVYSVIYAYFALGTVVNWLYWVCTAFIFAGILLYHSEKPPQEKSVDHVTSPASSGNDPASLRGEGGDDEIVARRERGHLEDAFSYNPLGDRDEEDPQYRF